MAVVIDAGSHLGRVLTRDGLLPSHQLGVDEHESKFFALPGPATVHPYMMASNLLLSVAPEGAV